MVSKGTEFAVFMYSIRFHISVFVDHTVCERSRRPARVLPSIRNRHKNIRPRFRSMNEDGLGELTIIEFERFSGS